jgi:mono/diheme cytochrome c family protein
MASYRAEAQRTWKVAAFAAGENAQSHGREEFQESCAARHGADASGRGELANKLMKPPKDLTMIAEENGGTFPFWRVFDIIAGDTKVEGHDTSQMPLFSERMRGQESAGVFPPAPLRVLALTHYLESIQE